MIDVFTDLERLPAISRSPYERLELNIFRNTVEITLYLAFFSSRVTFTT
jgi:hypothetical protein